MTSSTSRTFCGDIGRCWPPRGLRSQPSLLHCSVSHQHSAPPALLTADDSLRSAGLLAARGVAAERARRRELAQLVADHVLGDVDRHVAAPVVDGDRVADHLREDRESRDQVLSTSLRAAQRSWPRPSEQLRVDVRALLRGSTHRPLPAPRYDFAATMNLSVSLLSAGLLAHRRLAPGGLRLAANRRLALATTVGMVARVHRPSRAPSAAEPSQRLRPALPSLSVPCSGLPTCADGRHADRRCTRRTSPLGQADLAPSRLPSPSAAPTCRRCAPSAPPRPGFSSMLWIDVPDRDVPQGQRVARRELGLGAGADRVPDLQADRREDVALLAVRVLEQRDARRAVRIVLDRRRPAPARRACCASSR